MNKKQAAEVLKEHRVLLRGNALFNSNGGNCLTMALQIAIEELEAGA